MRKGLCVFVCSLLWAAGAWGTTAPKNVIMLIGDGMGFEQVRAAGMYLNGSEGTLCFESLPYQGEVTTANWQGITTDSAAAATAMATGYKVINGPISTAQPPPDASYVWGDPLPTVLEILAGQGKSTGLVTTTYITHATPAAFGAHAMSRNDTSVIADWYMNQNQPNVLLGGGGYGMSPAGATTAGYTVATTAAELFAVDTETETHVSGQFGTGYMPYESAGLGAYPHLSEMATTALATLDNDPDGFFLMVEGGRIDHGGHDSNIENVVLETIEFANAVQVALDWAAGRDDTLIIVTADHETGGLIVDVNNGQGVLPDVTWTGSGGHTGVNVPVYAWGPNAELVAGVIDNTDFFELIQVPEPATMVFAVVGLVVLTVRRRAAV